MRVLVVWEPILTTDWRPPGAAALGRISDGRARQFWDPGHLVAAALNETAKQKPPPPQPACCIQKGFYWDEAIGTHRTGAGETHPRPFFGAARFFESFQVRRRPSPKSPDGSRRGERGVGHVEYGREQKSVLQFTGSDVLLVRDLSDCVGSSERSWHLLAPSALVLCLHHSFCHGDRLRGHLEQEPLVLLRDHRPAVSHRGHLFSFCRPAHRSR